MKHLDYFQQICEEVRQLYPIDCWVFRGAAEDTEYCDVVLHFWDSIDHTETLCLQYGTPVGDYTGPHKQMVLSDKTPEEIKAYADRMAAYRKKLASRV